MYAYGKHLGLAFQVVDDILDFTQVGAGMHYTYVSALCACTM